MEEDRNDGMLILDLDRVAEVLESYWGDLFLERKEMSEGEINMRVIGSMRVRVVLCMMKKE